MRLAIFVAVVVVVVAAVIVFVFLPARATDFDLGETRPLRVDDEEAVELSESMVPSLFMSASIDPPQSEQSGSEDAASVR